MRNIIKKRRNHSFLKLNFIDRKLGRQWGSPVPVVNPLGYVMRIICTIPRIRPPLFNETEPLIYKLHLHL